MCALDAALYRERPTPRVKGPSHAEVAGCLFRALVAGQEAVVVGGDEAALRAAGFEILPCSVLEAVRVCKPAQVQL